MADDLVDMAALFPTICDLAGIELPASLELDGISLAPRLRDGTPPRQHRSRGSIGHQARMPCTGRPSFVGPMSRWSRPW